MTDSTPAEALNANHFHARGGRVWNDGLMDPDAYRRMIYQRWGIDPEEKFVALDPAMRERSINLLRDAARALRCRSCGCLTFTANTTARCGCHGRPPSDEALSSPEMSRVAAVVSHRYRIDSGAVFAMLSDGWRVTPPLTRVDDDPNGG